jgi:hypothetical protein
MSNYITVLFDVLDTNLQFNIELAKCNDIDQLLNFSIHLISLSLINTLYKCIIVRVSNDKFTIDSIDLTYWHQLACVKLNLKMSKPIITLDLPLNTYNCKPVAFQIYQSKQLIKTIDFE